MFALLIAFNERLRETLWRAQKLIIDIVADFLLAPITFLFQWWRRMGRKGKRKRPGPGAESENNRPKMTGRRGLGKYRRNGKIQRQQSGEDIWSEHEDKMLGGGGAGVGRMGLVDGEVERERMDPYAEKGRGWGVDE